MTPVDVLAQMKERFVCVKFSQRQRKTVMVPIPDFILYMEALAAALDERDLYAARMAGTLPTHVREPSVPTPAPPAAVAGGGDPRGGARRRDDEGGRAASSRQPVVRQPNL
jgi:hypothetical protein